jgi:hypothetical protein
MKLRILRSWRNDAQPAPTGGSATRRTHSRISRAVDWLNASCGAWEEHDLASRVLLAANGRKGLSLALALARALAARDRGTLLIDTSQGAQAISSLLELPRSPGLAELCQGTSNFTDVIRRDTGSDCQFLGSGRPRAVGGAWGAPGEADRIFRALDESYRWILVCAELDEALGLAANLKRQFSAAVLIDGPELRVRQPFLSDIFYRHKFPVHMLSGG